MAASYFQMQELLRQRAEYQARLNLLPYDGSPEVKKQGEKEYLYVRKRMAGRLTSTYVDVYSDALYQLLLRNARERRELNKNIRHINKELADLGYEDAEIPARIAKNLEFARANMKVNIYDQAVLEGVATSFPQTEEIIENGIVNGVSADDVQKILNLKHAWEFILDPDVARSASDYYVLCHIARLVNEGLIHDGGRIRGVPVGIGGSSYVPPLPIEPMVRETLDGIVGQTKYPADVAIEICLYCMKTQIFLDGNKRAAVIFANHYLIGHGEGFLVIPEARVPEFKKMLVAYYEGEDAGAIASFLKNDCLRTY